MLWWRAFQSVPAGSLPFDDFELAKAAGYGRDLAKWFGVKHAALHNFVRCSDGRLYHPVVCEIALAAWKRRVNSLKRKEKFLTVKRAQGTRAERVPERVPDAFGTRLQERTGQDRTGEDRTGKVKKESLPSLTPPPREAGVGRTTRAKKPVTPPTALGGRMLSHSWARC
jgi:hypothetical protein